jgi:hypothetical protein
MGRGAFCSILAPAARVRLTGTAKHAVRPLVRATVLGMVRVVVMACRVVPGCTLDEAKRSPGKGFCNAYASRWIEWPPGGLCSTQEWAGSAGTKS